jgi:hypothetical protein
MSAESDRSLSRRDNARFFLCLTLSLALLLGPHRWGEVTGDLIRRSVLVPFLYLQERAEDARTSRAVRERLTSERDSAAYSAQLLPAVRLENQRLRGLMMLGQRLTTHFVAADGRADAAAEPRCGRRDPGLRSSGRTGGTDRDGAVGVGRSQYRHDLGPSRIPGQRVRREWLGVRGSGTGPAGRGW